MRGLPGQCGNGQSPGRNIQVRTPTCGLSRCLEHSCSLGQGLQKVPEGEAKASNLTTLPPKLPEDTRRDTRTPFNPRTGQAGIQETTLSHQAPAGSLFLGPLLCRRKLEGPGPPQCPVQGPWLPRAVPAEKPRAECPPPMHETHSGQAAQPTIPRPALTGSPPCRCQPPPPLS